jgi:hypothetical protein
MLDNNQPTLVLRTRNAYSFSPWLTMLLGIVLLVLGVKNLNYEQVRANSFVWVAATLALVVILFILPLRNIGSYKQIVIENEYIKFVKMPSRNETEYFLGNLKSWVLKDSISRYDYGRNLYLAFDGGVKIHVSEMEYTDFESLINYFNKFYKAKNLKQLP